MDICNFQMLLRQVLLNEIPLDVFAETFSQKWLKEPFEDPFNKEPGTPMNEALFFIIETLFGFAEDYHPQFPDSSPFDVDEQTLRKAILDAYADLVRFLEAHPEYTCPSPK